MKIVHWGAGGTGGTGPEQAPSEGGHVFEGGGPGGGKKVYGSGAANWVENAPGEATKSRRGISFFVTGAWGVVMCKGCEGLAHRGERSLLGGGRGPMSKLNKKVEG